ncbi:hypothetical protein OAC51_06105 [Flavobacteriaceae bacterium]|nr:hypothetical protein [Flavobacteriaceae bacterium]
MKNIVLLISIFCLFACSQNQADEPVVQDAFIDNALSILDELGNYYPPEDIDLLVSKVDSNGFQTATFSLKGETKKTIKLGSFAKRQYAYRSDGTTCTNKWQCGKEIANCLDDDKDATISNGACENSAWCVTCVEPS